MNREELNKLLAKQDGDSKIIKRLELNDGEHISVQASEYHYCTPRENCSEYIKVEVGYPSVDPGEAWKEYFDGDWETTNHTESVYGYVPIDLVLEFINSHGGVAGE